MSAARILLSVRLMSRAGDRTTAACWHLLRQYSDDNNYAIGSCSARCVQVAYVADLQDMCEELQSMQATMTEQAAESGQQVCPVTCWQRGTPAAEAAQSCFDCLMSHLMLRFPADTS